MLTERLVIAKEILQQEGLVFMLKVDTKFGKTPVTKKKPVARALPPEEEFSYFCKFDELSGVMACPGVVLRPLKESCYRSRKAVFKSTK